MESSHFINSSKEFQIDNNSYKFVIQFHLYFNAYKRIHLREVVRIDIFHGVDHRQSGVVLRTYQNRCRIKVNNKFCQRVNLLWRLCSTIRNSYFCLCVEIRANQALWETWYQDLCGRKLSFAFIRAGGQKYPLCVEIVSQSEIWRECPPQGRGGGSLNLSFRKYLRHFRKKYEPGFRDCLWAFSPNNYDYKYRKCYKGCRM